MGKEHAACPARFIEWIESCCHLCDEFCKHGGGKAHTRFDARLKCCDTIEADGSS